MKKILSLILLVCTTNTILFAQTKELLVEISKKLSDYKTYRSTCNYTFAFPYGGTSSIASTLTLKKEINDSICGFHYTFVTNEKDRDLFGDFSMYFNLYSYKSYKGVVEKINNLEEVKSISKTISVDLPAKRPVLLGMTPFLISSKINECINKSNCTIVHKPDTFINNQSCIKFCFIEAKMVETEEVSIEIEYCFDKIQFYPVLCRETRNSTFINQAYFTNTEINPQLPINYYSEENLLPKNWQSVRHDKTELDSKSLIGKKAPKISLPILGQNKMMSFDELKGKYIIVEFTATWCGVCNVAAKAMRKIEDHFITNNDVEIILIFSSNQDKIETITKFASKYDLKSTILYNASSIEKKYHINGYPNYFIISPEGKVLFSLCGYHEGLEDNIINILNNYLDSR